MTGPKRLSVIFISLAASGLLATAGCAGSGSTVAPVQPTQSVPIAPSVRPLSADETSIATLSVDQSANAGYRVTQASVSQCRQNAGGCGLVQ